MRVMLGLVVQPFVAALLGFIVSPLVDYTGALLYGGHPADPFDSAVSIAAGIGFAGVLVTAFGALPALAWLLKRGPVTRRQTLISGAVLGNVPFILIVGGLAAGRLSQGAMPDLQIAYGPAGALRTIAFGSFIGTASAAVFWCLAGRSISVEAPAPVG
jgi:hypothetical protein